MTAIATLRSLGACKASINWGLAQRDRSPQALWSACPRGDWLAWYLGKLGARDGHGSPAHRRAVLVACLCARTASRYWRSPACERAVSLAERWAWGDETATRDDLRAAASAASDAYGAYAAYAAAIYAARDAVNAAYAADAAADAADAAAADAYGAYAAYAAAIYADYAADAAADAADAAAADADAAAADAAADAAAAYAHVAAARTAHLAALADLIRAAVPEVPL